MMIREEEQLKVVFLFIICYFIFVMSMKIIKYTKKNKNEYILTLDNNTSITLYDDTILKYNLLIKKEILNIDDILKYNDILKDYYNILSILIKKRKTIKEVEDILKDSLNKKDIIDRLIKEGYLNDTLYIKDYINTKLNTSLDGYNKILNNLTKLGIEESIIKCYLDKIDRSIWIDRINKIIVKKHIKESITIYKKKMTSYLYNMGYFIEDINTCLERIQSNDYDIIEKDYIKIKKVLERKYQGKELINMIKKKLYNKGYKIEDINKVVGN